MGFTDQVIVVTVLTPVSALLFIYILYFKQILSRSNFYSMQVDMDRGISSRK